MHIFRLALIDTSDRTDIGDRVDVSFVPSAGTVLIHENRRWLVEYVEIDLGAAKVEPRDRDTTTYVDVFVRTSPF